MQSASLSSQSDSSTHLYVSLPVRNQDDMFGSGRSTLFSGALSEEFGVFEGSYRLARNGRSTVCLVHHAVFFCCLP